MSTTRTSPFLRKALLADAAISGATGLLLALGAGSLADLLGVPAGLPRYAGIALLPFAALLVLLATRERLARPVVWAVIAANLVWAADSVLLLFVGWIEPTVLGVAFILAQAAVVVVFAELQWLGLRRWRRLDAGCRAARRPAHFRDANCRPAFASYLSGRRDRKNPP